MACSQSSGNIVIVRSFNHDEFLSLQACGFGFLVTGIWGTDLWQHQLLPGVLVENVLLWILELGLVATKGLNSPSMCIIQL